MLRIVCDRCNKVLSPVDEITSFVVDKGQTPKHYDFCEKCHKNFIKWFNNKEDLNEINNN